MNITTQIQGGLGNQLFQYATAKALSKRLQGQLRLDIEWFNHGWEDVTPRHFLLPDLRVQAQFIQIQPPNTPPKKWRRILQSLLPISPYILKDRPYRFNSLINRFKPYSNQDIYLTGYWQSFHYFDSTRAELLDEIQPRDGLSAHYQAYLEKIQASPSAMVHIRRGDYVHLPVAAKVHGFLGLDYYLEGIKLLLAKNPDIHFFVFSDDQEWARNNLPHQEKITFIESSEDKAAPVEELYLMSQCKMHLIANSSLSWWGAWLCSNKNAYVIAPKKWTNDQNKSWDDLLPRQWQRI
ncbi:alpha-1,2-fucosyltransferase [Polynucleobacter necessarius]|uniref:alpha-1,2-fucosyltransferase n=1 Tax=Polynucleobacter necessarius TaxID=576610 RepID=UPI000FE2172A|nr:alpha-1,2-fucosyltransferase [Polynucleobacter necessarius]